MTIVAIPALPAMAGPSAAAFPDAAAPTIEPGGFTRLIADGLRGVSGQLQASQVDLQRLAAGDVENLHHVMIRLEQSQLSLQLLLQVRQRLLESYQDVMRMQV
jgi:flagellar hook-basal body complex protein FliE